MYGTTTTVKTTYRGVGKLRSPPFAFSKSTVCCVVPHPTEEQLHRKHYIHIFVKLINGWCNAAWTTPICKRSTITHFAIIAWCKLYEYLYCKIWSGIPVLKLFNCELLIKGIKSIAAKKLEVYFLIV